MALLSAPVNPLTDYQLEYDGLLFGPGTPYDVPPELNLLDLVAVRNQDTDRDAGHDGAYTGEDSAGVAVFEVPFELYASTDAAFITAVQALRMAARIRRVDAPLWFKVPGLPVYGIGAKIDRRHLPISNTWPRLSVGALQFRVTRPRLQSIARTVQLAPIGATGGLGFPLFATYTGGGTTALDYGTVGIAAYSAILRNDGNSPAHPVVAVTGPNSGFAIALDGRTVTYPLPLGPVDTVTVDYATGQASLSVAGSAGVPRTGALSTRDFAGVPAASSSTIVLTASGGTAAVTTADIWR